MKKLNKISNNICHIYHASNFHKKNEIIFEIFLDSAILLQDIQFESFI